MTAPIRSLGDPQAVPGAPARRTVASLRARLLELMKFGFVGGLGFIVDIGVFNLLQHGPVALLAGEPIAAKIASVSVAMIVTWLGNRLWTFARQRTSTKAREFVGFVVVNIGGMAIAVLCLWVSRYVLGYTSPLADNISANVVGLVLGTAFRYFAYKHLVFTGSRAPKDEAPVVELSA